MMATLELEYEAGIRVFEFDCDGGSTSPRDHERIRKTMGVYIGPVGVPGFHRDGPQAARTCLPVKFESRGFNNYAIDTHHERLTSSVDEWCEAIAIASPRVSSYWTPQDVDGRGTMEIIAFLSGPFEVGELRGLAKNEWCEILHDVEGLQAIRLNGGTFWSIRESTLAKAVHAIQEEAGIDL